MSTSFLLFFNFFDLVHIEVDRSFSAEHGNHDADFFIVCVKLLNNTEEAGQRSVNNLYGVAHLEADNDLAMLDAQIILSSSTTATG